MQYTPYLVPVSVKGIVFEEDRVWLRKNERDEWELPGGKIDPGEQPEETVARELLEELGFEVIVEDVVNAHMYTIAKSTDEEHGVLVIAYSCVLKSKSGNFELIGEAGKSDFRSFTNDQVQELNMPEFYKGVIAKANNLRA